MVLFRFYFYSLQFAVLFVWQSFIVRTSFSLPLNTVGAVKTVMSNIPWGRLPSLHQTVALITNSTRQGKHNIYSTGKLLDFVKRKKIFAVSGTLIFCCQLIAFLDSFSFTTMKHKETFSSWITKTHKTCMYTVYAYMRICEYTVPPETIYPFTEVLPRPILRLTPRSRLCNDTYCMPKFYWGFT